VRSLAQTGIVFSPLLEIHTIELPKLTQELATEAAPDDQAFVRWCRYLSSQDLEEIHQLTEEDPMIEKAEIKLSAVSTDPKLRELALERERRDIAHRLTLTAAWDEGRTEGRAEGRTEGRTEAERLVLQKLLPLKFGTLSEETRKRLETADEPTLNLWIERFVSASTLGEIFI
jgi:predicted transposase/invertase (TIGR01784 family)